MWVARGDPAGSGWLPAEELRTSGGGSYTWLAIPDMEEDGAADLVVRRGWRNFYSSAAVLLLRQDPLHPGEWLDALRQKTPMSVGAALGDFDGDGLTDVVVSSRGLHVVPQDPAAPGQLLPARRVQVVEN